MRQILLRLLLPIERRREGPHLALEAAARWQEYERRAAVQRIYEQIRADDERRP
jgi:hypothetical protein